LSWSLAQRSAADVIVTKLWTPQQPSHHTLVSQSHDQYAVTADDDDDARPMSVSYKRGFH